MRFSLICRFSVTLLLLAKGWLLVIEAIDILALVSADISIVSIVSGLLVSISFVVASSVKTTQRECDMLG